MSGGEKTTRQRKRKGEEVDGEQVDVMQPLAAITQVLCSRSTVAARLTAFLNVHFGCFNRINIHLVIPLCLFSLVNFWAVFDWGLIT